MAIRELMPEQFKLSLSKMCASADYYSSLSPELSKFIMNQIEKVKSSAYLPTTARNLRCEYCASLFRPDNHTVTLEPMLKASKKIGQLLRKHTKGEKLSTFQTKMLERYSKSHNVLVIKCFTCRKKTHIPCQDRRDRFVQRRSLEPTPETDESTVSKKAKKRQRQNERRKRAHITTSSDSGLDVSCVSSSSSRYSLSSAASTAASVSLSSTSVSTSSLESAASLGANYSSEGQLTSTPIRRTSTPLPNHNVMQPQVSALLPSNPFVLLSTSTLKLDSSTAPQRKKPARKQRSSRSVLQHMLAMENKSKPTTDSKSALHKFLSNV